MKFFEKTSQGGIVFLIDNYLDMPLFKNLLEKLATRFSAKVEWISMPEAEIGKIQVDGVNIYGKLDFDYGAELQCSGFSNTELSDVRAILTAH